MPAGRPAKPLELHVIEGTFRKDRHGDGTKAAPLKDSRPPAYLKDKISRTAWKDFYRVLDQTGLVSILDRTALELLTVTYARWREAHDLARIGLYKTESGYPMVSPIISLEQNYAKALQSLLREFGMTPSGRAKITLPMPGDFGDEDLD